jgi:hemerythrin
MAWSDELRTGIDEIDDQHQVLFECLKRLEQAVTDDERWSALHFAIEELEDFVRIHFAVEESLMRLHHYPLFSAHVEEHRGFERELRSLKERSVRTDVSREMVSLLKRWLVNHIGKSDHQYVPHLRTAGVVLS